MDETLMPVPLCVADAADAAVSHTGGGLSAPAAWLSATTTGTTGRGTYKLFLSRVWERVPWSQTETQFEETYDDPLGREALSLSILPSPIKPERQS